MKKGEVILLGGGCGDLSYLTLAGRQALESADVVVYDALVNPGLLRYAKEAEKIYVGKRGIHHTMEQDEINDLLASLALDGNLVVRLKGGDPFVFGRGGEECEALQEAGVPFSVIPGISSALGGLLSAGIPVSHRDEDHAFAVITGQPKDEVEEIDWDILARFKGALIFLMGMKNLGHITDSLLKAGKDPETPAAVVHAASTPEQETVFSTLKGLPRAARGMKAPSVIIIGGVVRHAVPFREDQGRYPLFGKRILTTREGEKNDPLIQAFSKKGAEVITCPAIKTVPLEEGEISLKQALGRIDAFTDLVFTSPTGVSLFFKTLFSAGKDARDLNHLRITTIGPGSAKELKNHGITPDLIAEKSTSEGLFEELKPYLSKESKVLIPRSRQAIPYLKEHLLEICPVEEVYLYESVPDMRAFMSIDPLIRENKISAVTLMSASSAKAFLGTVKKAGLEEQVCGVPLITIGPETSRAVNEEEFTVYKESPDHTIKGMIETIETEFCHASNETEKE